MNIRQARKPVKAVEVFCIPCVPICHNVLGTTWKGLLTAARGALVLHFSRAYRWRKVLEHLGLPPPKGMREWLGRLAARSLPGPVPA